jgi:hypothetical protein
VREKVKPIMVSTWRSFLERLDGALENRSRYGNPMLTMELQDPI